MDINLSASANSSFAFDIPIVICIYFNQMEQLMTPTIKINDVALGTKHSTLDNYFISGNVWSEGREGGRERKGWESYRIIWRIILVTQSSY